MTVTYESMDTKAEEPAGRKEIERTAGTVSALEASWLSEVIDAITSIKTSLEAIDKRTSKLEVRLEALEKELNRPRSSESSSSTVILLDWSGVDLASDPLQSKLL